MIAAKSPSHPAVTRNSQHAPRNTQPVTRIPHIGAITVTIAFDTGSDSAGQSMNQALKAGAAAAVESILKKEQDKKP